MDDALSRRQGLQHEELRAADARAALDLPGAEAQIADDAPERVEDLAGARLVVEAGGRGDGCDEAWEPIRWAF